MKALHLLDVMIGKKRNRALLLKAFQKAFREDPVRFFTGIVMPLLPKESRVISEKTALVEWASLATVSVKGRESAVRTTEAVLEVPPALGPVVSPGPGGSDAGI